MRTFFLSLSALALLALTQEARAAVPINTVAETVARTAGEANGFRRGGGHVRAHARVGHRSCYHWGHRRGGHCGRRVYAGGHWRYRWGYRHCFRSYGSFYRPACHTYCRPYCYRTSCYRPVCHRTVCYRPVVRRTVCYRPVLRRSVCERVFYRPYCVRTRCAPVRPVLHARVTVRATVRP